MKNKLILFTFSFLITTPLIAMEEGAGLEGPLKRLKLEEIAPASPEAQSLADQITIELMDGEVKLDKARFLPILQQSQTISDLLEDIPTEKIEFLLPNITKGNFEVAISLIEFLKEGNNAAIDLAFEELNVKELSNLWNIFNFLDVPALQKKTQAQLDNTLASHIEENPDSIPDLLTHLPESFKQDKFSIPFSSRLLPKDLVPSFNELATLQHGSAVTSVAFDPQHNLLATGSVDKTVKIYNSSDLNNNSKPIATLKHKASVSSVAFDPTDSLLAIGSDNGEIKIYNSSDLNNNSKPIATFKKYRLVNAIAFDSTNNLLAIGIGDKTEIYNSSHLRNDSKPIATLKYNNFVNSLAFNPTDSLLAIGIGDKTEIYNSSHLRNDSEPIATLKAPYLSGLSGDSSVRSVAFDPTDSLLAIGRRDRVGIYNSSHLRDDSKPIATLNFYGPSGVRSVAFDSAHSLLAIGSVDKTVKIYNSSHLRDDSEPIATLQHKESVNSVAFDSTHSLLATGSFDNTAKIYKYSTFFSQLTNEQGLAVLYLLLTKPESLTNVPEVIQQIITTIDKETWSTISEYLKPE